MVDIAALFFGYVPNRPANIVALVIFAILFLALFTRIYRTKCSKIYFLLAFTAILQTIGFALRLVCAKNPNVKIFTAMFVFLMVPANIMTVINYKALGDVVGLSNNETRFLVIGPHLFGWFIKSNILATIFQVVGGIMQTSAKVAATGKILLLVGVSLQVIFFGCFLLCVWYVRRSSDYEYTTYDGKAPKNKVTLVILLSMVIIFARNVYRLQSTAVTYVSSPDKEWSFYVFDALLVAVSLALHGIFMIGKDIPARPAEPIDSNEKQV